MRIPPAKIHFSEEDRQIILARIEESLSTGQLTLGKFGREFEEAFAAFHGAAHAVSVSSGTSAIEIPLRILGVEGKEVLVPTNTFFATPAAALHAGAKVRFVDADPETLSINLDHLRASITPETAGVIVVHIAGVVTPAMPEIRRLCQEKGIFLFEDAAHAHGSKLGDQFAGTFGDAASFSFYPTKVITSGEGGMIVTNDERIKNEAMLYRDQGKISFTQNLHDKLGSNWRMSEPHAAIGLQHLKRLEEFIEERMRIAGWYDDVLSAIPGIAPLPVPEECRSSYYKYIAMLDDGIDRAHLKKRLREEFDVGLSGEVYELPCHQQPIFKEIAGGESFPYAEDICRRHVCMPIFQGLTQDDVSYVAESLRKVLSTP
ncbi:MAG: DegT/DnrJ/EryC1/StrS family aminotransferase [bacterium]|nr:DegT/DnrJ/EryC1/StrS family aminotransferase [bacterium]